MASRGKELGLKERSGGVISLKEQLARTTLRNVRLKGHTYELRDDYQKILGEPGSGGSSTLSMVGAVNKWQKSDPQNSKDTWNKSTLKPEKVHVPFIYPSSTLYGYYDLRCVREDQSADMRERELVTHWPCFEELFLEVPHLQDSGLCTTSVRKLFPESWGFVCPVHTPDGAPCGLLNQMTASCTEFPLLMTMTRWMFTLE
ncbi:DNA-directed RNA polymerase I subunit 2, partial [Tanacetum coccineum]